MAWKSGLRHAGLLLFAAKLFPLSPAAVDAQSLPTRAYIDLLIVSDDAIATTRMRQWSNALISRLSRLSDDQSLGLERRIVVASFPQATFVGSEVLQARWQQRRAMQVVLAQGVSVDGRVTAEGSLFLGTLKGDLASPSIPIKQPITPENYQKSSDYIVLTALYALAIDAQSRKPVACALLHQADLLGRNIPVAIDSARVRDAVKRHLISNRCSVVQ